MSEAARIIYPPEPRAIMVTKGQRLVLECVASGIPTPQVKWAKDGLDLRSHNNTRFLLSNLLIDAVSEYDSGTYVCRADNGMGTARSATALYNVQVFGEQMIYYIPSLANLALFLLSHEYGNYFVSCLQRRRRQAGDRALYSIAALD